MLRPEKIGRTSPMINNKIGRRPFERNRKLEYNLYEILWRSEKARCIRLRRNLINHSPANSDINVSGQDRGGGGGGRSGPDRFQA